jgi:hypothetical protein
MVLELSALRATALSIAAGKQAKQDFSLGLISETESQLILPSQYVKDRPQWRRIATIGVGMLLVIGAGVIVSSISGTNQTTKRKSQDSPPSPAKAVLVAQQDCPSVPVKREALSNEKAGVDEKVKSNEAKVKATENTEVIKKTETNKTLEQKRAMSLTSSSSSSRARPLSKRKSGKTKRAQAIARSDISKKKLKRHKVKAASNTKKIAKSKRPRVKAKPRIRKITKTKKIKTPERSSPRYSKKGKSEASRNRLAAVGKAPPGKKSTRTAKRSKRKPKKKSSRKIASR